MSIKEKAIDLFDSAKEPAFNMTCELFLDGVIGTIAPSVVTTYIAYKQKRQEKMYEEFMIQTKGKIEILENRLRSLNENQYYQFKEKFFGLVSDYVFDEIQEEKIQYMVNGLINIASLPNIKEDFILTYYDILKELRIRDIAILKFYADIHNFIEDKKTWSDICTELNINYDEYNSIREKLNRVGLLTTKRDLKIDNLYDNILNIQDFLEKLSKGKKCNVKPFKKIDKKDSFQISKFGREFMDFFINI